MQVAAPYIRLLSAFLAWILIASQCALPAVSADKVSYKANPMPAPFYVPDIPVPVYWWVKDGVKPNAVVLALHGGAMHGRSFNVLGKLLCNKGYPVVSLDMRGYGVPFHEKMPGVRKFNYRKSVSDIYKLIGFIKNEYPDTPVICLGESMGANMALYIGGDAPELIDGIIAISPFAAPKFFMYPQMGAHLVQFLMNPGQRLNMAIYLKRRLAHDRERALVHLQDPLARHVLSVPELVQTAFFNLKGKRNSQAIPAGMPVLFMVGEFDRLCSFKATAGMLARIPSADKRLLVMRDQGHLMVEADIIRPVVTDALLRWLDEQRETKAQVAQQKDSVIR